jgi:hypothetical protein
MLLIIVEGRDIVTVRVRAPRRRLLGMFSRRDDRDGSGGGARGDSH